MQLTNLTINHFVMKQEAESASSQECPENNSQNGRFLISKVFAYKTGTFSDRPEDFPSHPTIPRSANPFRSFLRHAFCRADANE